MGERNGNCYVATVMAALNEAEGIGLTIEELRSHLPDAHLLVVDGRSNDRTVEIAKDKGATVLIQEGTGKGQALGQGIEQLPSGIRYIVFIDADFSYPAEYIPKMIEILDHNPDVGMVVGNRFNGDIRLKAASADRFYIGNRLLAFAQHLVNGIKLRDPLSGLRVAKLEALNGWKPKSKSFDVEAEMNYRVECEGYQIVELPIKYRPRLGEKKLKLRHGLIILKRILSESIVNRLHNS
jgi:glycosyltransferase involved in cell wall biosynthesis